MCTHGNIAQVIQITKHTHLSKLSNTRQQRKAQIGISTLQYAIKCLQGIAKLVLQRFISNCLKNRFVVFVNKYDNIAPRLLLGCAN